MNPTLEAVAREMVREWKMASDDVATQKACFIPKLAVTIRPGSFVWMKALTRQDLLAWRKRKARSKALVAYIDQRLAEFEAHPEISTLGELEHRLRGRVETEGDENPFAGTPYDDT